MTAGRPRRVGSLFEGFGIQMGYQAAVQRLLRAGSLHASAIRFGTLHRGWQQKRRPLELQELLWPRGFHSERRAIYLALQPKKRRVNNHTQ